MLRQVFVVGMNGSGTTMVLDHLANHSMIYGFPGETKCLPYYIQREGLYGDLSSDANFLRLWSDIRSSIIGRLVPGPERIPLPENWREKPRSAASIFDQVMCLFAADAEENKKIWCEKSPMYVHHIGLLASAYPNAKFIHAVRDGRDCAASFHRRWKFHPLRTAYRWKNAVRCGRAQGLALADRYLEVRYEDLTKSPKSALVSICNFLSIPYESAVLEAARTRASMTGSDNTEIVPNSRKAAEYFSSRRLAQIETIAGACLEEFGYKDVQTRGDSDPQPLALRMWQLQDDARRLWRILSADGSIADPRQWPYFARRIRIALLQKAVL